MSRIMRNYWDRVGHIRVSGPDGKMHRYGNDSNSLDFKFDVQKTCGDIYIDFTVSILGLNAETINFLATWNQAEAYRDKRIIEVYAGYDDDGKAPLIARGVIVNAIPSSPPEMWLNIQAKNIYSSKAELVTESAIGYESKRSVKKRDFFYDTMQYLGYKFSIATDIMDADKIITIPSFVCDKSELVKRVARITGWLIHVDNGYASAHAHNGWSTDSKFDAADIINVDNGLIGISQIDIKGAVVKCRLNDQYQLFSNIYLESKLIPKANGIYFIVSKRSVGHLRGDDWYTELKLIRRVKK